MVCICLLLYWHIYVRQELFLERIAKIGSYVAMQAKVSCHFAKFIHDGDHAGEDEI